MIWKVWVVCCVIAGLAALVALATLGVYMFGKEPEYRHQAYARDRAMAIQFWWGLTVATVFATIAWVIWP